MASTAKHIRERQYPDFPSTSTSITVRVPTCCWRNPKEEKEQCTRKVLHTAELWCPLHFRWLSTFLKDTEDIQQYCTKSPSIPTRWFQQDQKLLWVRVLNLLQQQNEISIEQIKEFMVYILLVEVICKNTYVDRVKTMFGGFT